MSPTARSLKHLRERGYLCDVVERWVPKTSIKRDLFGMFDIVAIKDGERLCVQTTSGSNVAARVKKIRAHENLAQVRRAGFRVLVHGWRKSAAGRWVLREVDLT